MASSVNADNGVVSGTAGLKSSADNSGVLDLQTNGTTAISISASQVVTFANQPAYTGGTANGVLYLNGSKVVTSGSALVFDGTNLGLGVTPSAWASYKAIDLNVGGLAIAGGGESGAIAVNCYFNSGWKYKTTGTYRTTRYDQYDGAHYWLTAPAGTAGNAITFTQAMTLDASGNLGIGSTAPSGRLTLQRASAGASTDITWKNEVGNDRARIRFGGTNEELSFWTPGASIPEERMRIDLSGQVTTPYQSGFTAALGAGSQASYAVGALIFATEIFDTASNYNPANGRYTVPVSGKYFISVNLRWENTQAATAYWSAQVYVNGGIPSYTIGNLTPVAANSYSFSNWSGVISLSAGDYVQAGVRSANGGNFTTVQSECSFSGFLLG